MDSRAECTGNAYLDLRHNDRGLMVSRGQYRGQAQRNQKAMHQLEINASIWRVNHMRETRMQPTRSRFSLATQP